MGRFLEQESAANRIGALQFAHSIPAGRMAELLGADIQQLSEWKCKKVPVPTEVCARLDGVARSLRLNSEAAWVNRVTRSSGSEALFDRHLVFLAVSDLGRSVRSKNGKNVTLPVSTFIGRPYPSLLPPTQQSLTGYDAPGFSGLLVNGFFDGVFQGLQIKAEFNFGPVFAVCTMEFWPVLTVDNGILAHSVSHHIPDAEPTLSEPGIQLHGMNVF